MSANRRIADDVVDQVVTAVDVFVRPRAATRTQTLPSGFEMSIPALREWTTSMTASSTAKNKDGWWARQGVREQLKESHPRARRQQLTAPHP